MKLGPPNRAGADHASDATGDEIAARGHRWLVTAREARAGARTILCFPHAGGTPLSAGQLARHLPESAGLMAVNLPGREKGDPIAAPRRASLAARAIADSLGADLASPSPQVFLGNSYGALLAYETARALVRQGESEPRLIVSGFRSPSLPPAEGPLFSAPRALLRSELAARFGVSGRDLDRIALDLFETALRADLEACETYRHEGPDCLTRRIDVLAMSDDPAVSHDELLAWQRVSSGGVKLHPVAGQHFCWNLQPAEVATAVMRLLDTEPLETLSPEQVRTAARSSRYV